MAYELIDLSYQKKVRTKEELIKHLESFSLDLKLSTGIWYYTPASNRFHEPYGDPKTIEQRLDMMRDLPEFGVKGLEAHYPLEINEENLDLYKDFEKDTGIKVATIPFALFYSRETEFGSLSSPYPKIRKKAEDIVEGTLKIVKELGSNCAILWPGADGYTYAYGNIYPWMWNNFETVVANAMDKVPGIRIAIEPKPYEPVPNNIYRTTPEGILAAKRIEAKLKNPTNVKLVKENKALVAMNPEAGHVRMGFEILPHAFSICTFEGRLAHTHWNSQPSGNYDQDLNVGVVDWTESEALLYALKMAGYNEFFGIDINPEKMPVQKAIELNYKALSIMNERIDSLPHEEIIECYLNPGENRGRLEDILLNSMKKKK